MASKATNIDFVKDLNDTTEQSAGCFDNGTSGFVTFRPSFACVELMLLSCDGSGVTDDTIVRTCTPEEGSYHGQLNGRSETTQTPAEEASTYLGPAPTTTELLNATMSTSYYFLTAITFVPVFDTSYTTDCDSNTECIHYSPSFL